MFFFFSGFGPPVSDFFPQIRHRDVSHRRHPEPGIPPFLPGRSGLDLSLKLRVRPATHEEAGRHVDEGSSGLPSDLDAGIESQLGRVHLHGGHSRRR